MSLVELTLGSTDSIVEKELRAKLETFRSDPSSVIEDGEYYFDTRAPERQVARGPIKKTEVEFFLFIDTLIFCGVLIEVDWKGDEEELIESIEELAKKQGCVLPEIAPTEESITENSLKRLNGSLEAWGLTIYQVDINSDSHVIGITDADHLAALTSAAESAGIRIERP